MRLSLPLFLALILASQACAGSPFPGGVLDSTGRTAYLATGEAVVAVDLSTNQFQALTFGLDNMSAEEGYETIAGFLVQQLRKNPVEGDKLEEFGYRFEVIDMDGRRIDKILMMKIGHSTAPYESG